MEEKIMLKIIKNPDEDKYNKITKAVKKNGNYCPCRLAKTPENKCMCKEFKEQTVTGECHCGRFIKVEA